MNSIFNITKQLSILVFGAVLSFQTLAETTVASDISQAERIVVDFYDKIFVQHGGDVRKVATQHVHENYIQHNPWVATGREAFINAFTRVVKKRSASSKTVIKRVITSGDYVVLHVHAYDTTKAGPGSAGVDTFRVVNGKIMEHWDVWQTIPEKMPHDNGMI